MASDRDYAVAIHEAGHVTGAIVQGHGIREVTVVPCPHGTYAGRYKLAPMHPRYAHDLILIQLAGPEAQALVDSTTFSWAHEPDWQQAWDKLVATEYRHGMTREEMDNRFEGLRQEAGRLVKRHWAMIDDLAQQLLRFGTLTGDQVLNALAVG